MFGRQYTDWWTQGDHLHQVMHMAWEIDQRYPNDHIAALGESFAWTVYATGIKRQAQNNRPKNRVC